MEASYKELLVWQKGVELVKLIYALAKKMLDDREFADWKSKILTSNLSPAEAKAIKMGVRRAPQAFTERGLYMLAVEMVKYAAKE